MNWTTITEQTIFAYLAAPRAQALARIAVASGQSDPLTEIIADTVTLIRGRLASAGLAVDPDVATVPPELRSAACALAIEAVQTRFPQLGNSPEQKRAAEVARENIARACGGELALTPPSGVVTPSPSGPHMHVVRRREQSLTSHRLKGL